MAQLRWEVKGGKIHYDGRPLAVWVDEAVADMVRAVGPARIYLFGSVARGDDGPDSDLDFLVVEDGELTDREKLLLSIRLRLAIHAPVPVDIFVVGRREFERRRDAIGSICYWPAREGRIVHDRVA